MNTCCQFSADGGVVSAQRSLDPHSPYLYDTCFRRCIWLNRSSTRGPAATLRGPSGQGWKTSASSPRRQRRRTTSSSAARAQAALSPRGPPSPGPSAIFRWPSSVPRGLMENPPKFRVSSAPEPGAPGWDEAKRRWVPHVRRDAAPRRQGPRAAGRRA